MKRKIIIADTAGVCFGVERALKHSYEVTNKTEEGEEIYSLGPIIHNPQVVGDLEQRGVKVAKSLEDVRGRTVLIRAHGIPIETMEAARRRDLNVVDLTCPIVKKLQNCVKRLSQDGYFVVIVGDKKHPEVIGALSHADPERVRVVEGRWEVDEDIISYRRVGVVAQTTIPYERLQEVVDTCLEMVDEVRVFNTICEDIYEKQREAKELAKTVDAMIIIGGRNSSNTTKIAKLCKEVNPSTYHIEGADEVCKLDIQGKETIGITAGASTPPHIIKEVIDRLLEV